MRIAVVIVFARESGFIVALNLRRAGEEGRPVNVFDDIVDPLGMPLLLIPRFVALQPPIAAELIMAVGAAILLIGFVATCPFDPAAGPPGNPPEIRALTMRPLGDKQS